jgi:hypothetical protein
VFINKCLGFKWKFQMLRDKGLRLELSLYCAEHYEEIRAVLVINSLFIAVA